MPVEVTRLLFH